MRATLRRMDSRGHFEGGVVLIVIEEDGRTATPCAGWLQILRSLSPAEQQVAHEVARGRSNADIGRALGKSAATVKKQLESVFGKAMVSSRAELGALFSGLAPTRVANKTKKRR